jgi:hypothetical protein
MPEGLTAVFGRLELALQRLEQGELEPRVASAMAALAGAMVRVWQIGLLEGRLEAMERLLDERLGPGAEARNGRIQIAS